MAIVNMDMCSYEVERCELSDVGCGDGMVSSGWNPALQLQQVSLQGKYVAMSPGLQGLDVESFLERMYAYQR